MMNVIRNLKWGLLALVAALPLTGCPVPSGPQYGVETAQEQPAEDGKLSGEIPESTPTDEALIALAERYLFQQVISVEEADPIFEEIRNLTDDDELRFRELAIGLQSENADFAGEGGDEFDVLRTFGSRLHRHVLEAGLSFVDATDDDIEGATEAISMEEAAFAGEEYPQDSGSAPRWCYPWQVACTVTAFGSSVTGQSYCPANGIGPTSIDNQENDPCATGGCDYRFRFPSSVRRTNVSGTTAAAICAIGASGGSLPSRQSGSNQWVLLGRGRFTLCAITTRTAQASLRIF